MPWELSIILKKTFFFIKYDVIVLAHLILSKKVKRAKELKKGVFYQILTKDSWNVYLSV